MSERTKTETEERWIVQYKPRENFPWMMTTWFGDRDSAQNYMQIHKRALPNVFARRVVHRVTVTTVTEEVVE